MVKTGLEVLLSDHMGELADASLGIVANHASVTSDLVHIADALESAGANINALFGPEHGARGDVADGEEIPDAVDDRLGVPVYSLYGRRTIWSSGMAFEIRRPACLFTASMGKPANRPLQCWGISTRW